MADRPHPATRAAQAQGRTDAATGALIPPLYATSTYLRDADNQYRRGLSYGRADNPTVAAAEALLGELEGGAGCLMFASGMAAATSVFQALAPGDHVLAPKVMYWGLRHWLLSFAAPWGLAVELIEMSEPGALEAAIRPGATRLVWIETPANPTWAITDIRAAAAIAHRAGARLAVDGTAATPVLSQPLALGADLVMHSATKYLNGHSDLVAGALVTAQADDLWQRITALRHDAGAILGAFEAWLLLRGMRTLFLRVERASASAQFLAERLRAHPNVAAVLYPGLPDHPGHRVAARQMRGGFGGMLSIRVRGGAAAAIATAARVRLWQRATSLGGVESLIEHRASIEGPGTPVPPDLLRLSVGIEHADDLLADLEQALHAQTDDEGVRRMATKASFTAEEWQRLLESPMLAAMAVTAADPSGLFGLVKEGFAASRALAEAKADAGSNELVSAVVADLETSEGRDSVREGLKAALAGARAADVKPRAIEGLRQLAQLLEAKAPGDAPAFKTWLATLAERVAEASKEGGFLGFGGVQVSDAEKATLAEISTALGHTA